MTVSLSPSGVRLLHAGLGDVQQHLAGHGQFSQGTFAEALTPEACARSCFALGFPAAEAKGQTRAGTIPFIEYPADTPAPVYLCGATSSSMDVARALAAADQLPVWGSVLAQSQKRGRGQFGRHWVSPEGNLYAALRLPLVPPFDGTAAAPAIGGLIAEALARLGFTVHMKWPNDLLQACCPDRPGWRKVGGILLEERRGGAFGAGMLIAGIGINLLLSPPESLMRAQRAVPAGCLQSNAIFFTSQNSVFDLWMRLVRRIFFCYVEEIDDKEKNAWRVLAERRLAFLGQSVLLADGPEDREQHRGVVAGLDDSGGLCLQSHGKTASFLSGSLQLDDIPMQP